MTLIKFYGKNSETVQLLVLESCFIRLCLPSTIITQREGNSRTKARSQNLGLYHGNTAKEIQKSKTP